MENQKKLLTGRKNYPLNEQGIDQAKEAHKRFEKAGIIFDMVISSPLDRALSTAKLVAPGAEIKVDDRLIEMEFGPYEGMDLRHPAPEICFFSDFEHYPAPPGMEPLNSVVERMGQLLEDLKVEAENKNILLSTHAIAMKGALSYLSDSDKGRWWSKTIENCSVYFTAASDGYYSAPQLLE